MKFKKIIPIALLMFIYLITIKSTICLYYFPYPAYPDFGLFLSHLPSSLLQYILLFGIIVFLLFEVFPGIITLLRAYKELNYRKIELSQIFFLSALPPILAFVNDYLTGNLLFSVILLIYGVLISLVGFMLRMLGSKKNIVPEKEIQTKELFEGLCAYIIELDPYRPPSNFGLSPYSFNLFFELLNKGRQLHLFMKKNPDLHKKVKNELYYFIKNTSYSYSWNKSFISGYSSSELLFRHMVTRYNQKIKKDSDPYFTGNVDLGLADAFVALVILLMFLLVFGELIFLYFNESGLSIIYTLLSILVIFLPAYFIIALISTIRRRNAGKKYDANIKKAIQELIDYGNEYIKKEKLNAEDYPIKLKHNDYKCLKYKIEGKNNYIGVFKEWR